LFFSALRNRKTVPSFDAKKEVHLKVHKETIPS